MKIMDFLSVLGSYWKVFEQGIGIVLFVFLKDYLFYGVRSVYQRGKNESIQELVVVVKLRYDDVLDQDD